MNEDRNRRNDNEGYREAEEGKNMFVLGFFSLLVLFSMLFISKWREENTRRVELEIKPTLGLEQSCSDFIY